MLGNHPQDDRYNQKADKKAFGYPKGQWTKFLDGRLLRGVQHDALRGMLATAATVTNDTGALVVRNPLRGRALWIPWAIGGTDWSYLDNVVASWQLWANNQLIASAMCGQFRADIGIYIPPESQVTFYLRVINNLPVNAVYHRYTVPWYEFDSDPADIWYFGSGGNTPNPAVGALAWP